MNISYLGKLNDDQRKAVIEENKKVCVIAGPGCGKTKTLVSRLTYLLEKKKISKDRILVLTFAKKAIKEIKKRVYEVTNLKESDELNIHNFHSFCFKLISKNSELLKLKNNGRFPVYDRSEQEFVIKKILQKRDIEDNKVEINSIISFINNVKNKKIKINRDLLTKKSEFIRNEIYEDYQEYLKINGAFDFNDLILFTIKILKENEEIRKAYERKFSYILLDEFQDINSIQ
jgi:DNA helicase-2/ATP-dependent DNA helicase PcrA